MHELTTRRLALRPFAPAERERLYEIFRDPYVRRYLFDSVLVSLQTVDEIIAASQASFREHGLGIWCASERTPDGSEPIGFAGVRPMQNGELELIYGFLPEHWGKGLAAEAARAVISRAFASGRARVWAGTDVENKASERVMQRLGLRFDRRETVAGLPQIYYVIERESQRA